MCLLSTGHPGQSSKYCLGGGVAEYFLSLMDSIYSFAVLSPKYCAGWAPLITRTFFTPITCPSQTPDLSSLGKFLSSSLSSWMLAVPPKAECGHLSPRCTSAGFSLLRESSICMAHRLGEDSQTKGLSLRFQGHRSPNHTSWRKWGRFRKISFPPEETLSCKAMVGAGDHRLYWERMLILWSY